MKPDGIAPFVRLGDILKAARIVAGMGGATPPERFYELWGDYAFVVIKTAQALGVLRPAKRRKGGRVQEVFVLDVAGISLLNVAEERCLLDARLNGGRLRISTPFGALDAELSTSSLLSLAYNISGACGEDPRVLYNKLKRAVERALKASRGLEKWLAHGGGL